MEKDEKWHKLYSDWLNKSHELYNRQKRLEEPLKFNLNDIKTRLSDIIDKESSEMQHAFKSIGKTPYTKPYRNTKTYKIDPDAAVWTNPLGGEKNVYIGGDWGKNAIPETELEKAWGDLNEYEAEMQNKHLEPESVVFPNQQNNNQEQNDSNKKSYWDKLSGLLKP